MSTKHRITEQNLPISFDDFKREVLNDYRIACISRECSLLGRREVLTGKGKFGIFGDGKELPQIAMAKVFKNGDFRSGYYRDQTFMMATDLLSPRQMFSAIYAHADTEIEPMSGGRQMGAHYSTHSLDNEGNWKDLTAQKNTSPDMSCTAGQMPRLVGLAQASQIYRNHNIKDSDFFSKNGNEVAWGTIGNASTSEGMFFEAINAAGVLQIPMVTSIWDDDYGISVHQKHQSTKENLSELLEGFRRQKNTRGIEIITVKGWDYPALVATYNNASRLAREKHIPIVIHVQNLTQPLGHSTSGSHERYKSKERLAWEKAYDCNLKFREWILEKNIGTEAELKAIEKKAKHMSLEGKQEAWDIYIKEIHLEQKEAINRLKKVERISKNQVFIARLRESLEAIKNPYRKDILRTIRKALRYTVGENTPEIDAIKNWISEYFKNQQPKYSSHLYSESACNPKKINAVEPSYDNDSKSVDGRIILKENFDKLLEKYPKLFIFGEDSGKIGDVNQGLQGLQRKYGEHRVADVGIRETTIIGQGIGLALRGLRPIAEIQYLDYISYAITTLSDDLACLHYRSAGKQKAPMIIRTRGHRLEGIFHAGSPMGGLLGFMRGIYLLVPRNMTQAAGFYNTLLASDQPTIVIEPLNGYRQKELMPNNLDQLKTPIGKVDILSQGKDITLVSYGSTLRIVNQAAKELLKADIHVEVIDCQSLIPFDLEQDIQKSIQKTNRLFIVDEDFPGGASAYILQKVIEEQRAYLYLDSPPHTMSAKEHRTAYGSDGNYFSKPNTEDIFEKIYEIMHEANPNKYPKLI